MAGHTISLILDNDGVHAHFNCDEPPDGWCHQVCAEECPVWTQECTENHPRTTVPYCNPIEFVDNTGFWYETYLGEDVSPHSGPVTFEWQGHEEWYGWRYADLAEVDVTVEPCVAD